LTAALMNEQIRDNLAALYPVGMISYAVRAATSTETLVDGVWLECNGVAVLRSTYSALNTLLNGLSYPFGNGNGSTTFNLPDLSGRSLVAMAASGHADVNGVGDSDGVSTVNQRTPKNAAHTHTGPSHTHSFSATSGLPSSTLVMTAGSDNSMATNTHTHSVSGTTGSGGTGTTGSGGAYTGSFLVAGVYLIKAVD
jgi:microcystin-dependent protein